MIIDHTNRVVTFKLDLIGIFSNNVIKVHQESIVSTIQRLTESIPVFNVPIPSHETDYQYPTEACSLRD